MRPLVENPAYPELGPVQETGPRAYKSCPYQVGGSSIHAVGRAGGMPMFIPILLDLSGLQPSFLSMKRLQFTCGIDVDPRDYHDADHPLLVEPFVNSMK